MTMNKNLVISRCMDRRACVTIRVTMRRVSRHPLTKKTIRSGSLLKKHVVRGATLGLLPSTMNDVIVHHVPLTFSEILHVTQDMVVVASLNALTAIAVTAIKNI